MSASTSDFTTDLSSYTMEEILNLQRSIGLKKFRKLYRSKNTLDDTSRKEIPKRKNKNRPQEISSKRPVTDRIRKSIKPAKSREIRDPRFDERSGRFDKAIFSGTYRFIDEMKEQETLQLRNDIRREEDADKREKMRTLLTRLRQQAKSKRRNAEKEAATREAKAALAAKAKSTTTVETSAEDKSQRKKKTRIFLSKSKVKQLETAEEFSNLKSAGKLDKYLKKKREKTKNEEL